MSRAQSFSTTLRRYDPELGTSSLDILCCASSSQVLYSRQRSFIQPHNLNQRCRAKKVKILQAVERIKIVHYETLPNSDSLILDDAQSSSRGQPLCDTDGVSCTSPTLFFRLCFMHQNSPILSINIWTKSAQAELHPPAVHHCWGKWSAKELTGLHGPLLIRHKLTLTEAFPITDILLIMIFSTTLKR